MNNLRIAQRAYDDMTDDDPFEYRESQHYSDWLAMVTELIIEGDESYGIDSHDALSDDEYVYDHIDDKHYFTFIEDQRDYD